MPVYERNEVLEKRGNDTRAPDRVWNVGQKDQRGKLSGEIRAIEPTRRRLQVAWEDGRTSWTTYPQVKALKEEAMKKTVVRKLRR